MSDLWHGLKAEARERLTQRDYSKLSTAKRLASTGVEAREIIGKQSDLRSAWIPGVELFPRRVYPQRHRGYFAEFARQTEGPLHDLGFWPRQWATARMFAGSAKGFHIHPPCVPEGSSPDSWFRWLYGKESPDLSMRPYDREQWDVMFFVQGNVEIFLADERAGLPRRLMRLIIEGDDTPGPNNAGIIIPPGVAHALRVEGSRDAIMVYGTSTTFDPTFEGRIADGIERAPIIEDWENYLRSGEV